MNQTSEKIISGGEEQLRTTQKEHQKSKTRSQDKPTIFLQHRNNLTRNFESKLKKLFNNAEETGFNNAEIKIMRLHP